MKIFRNIFLVFVFSIAFFDAKANRVTDSLETLLPKTADTVKAKILSDLCWEYRGIATEKAIEYGKQAIELCRKNGHKKFLAQSLNDLGIIYTDKTDFETSLALYNEALNIRKELKDDKGIAGLYLKIGIVRQKQGKLKEALENQLSALKIYERIKFPFGLSACLNNVALIHYNMGNIQKSLEYHFQSMKIKEEIGDEYGLAGSLVNVGNIYFEQKDYKQTITYLKKALITLRKIKDKEYLSACLNNLGSALSKDGNHIEALPLIKESLEIRKQVGDKKGMLSSYINYANVCFSLNKLSESKAAFEKALELSKDADVLQEQVGLYQSLANIYEKSDDYKSALKYNKLYNAMRDSMLNENLNHEVANMQTKYETEKKEKENIQLKNENRIKDLEVAQQKNQRNILIAFFLFVGIVAFFAFYLYRAKQLAKENASLLEQEKLRLNAIIQTQEKERKRISQELHDGVGQMMAAVRMNVSLFEETIDNEHQQVFQNTLKMIDTSCTELRQISHSMMPAILIKGGILPALKEQIEFINQSGKIAAKVTGYGLDERLSEIIEVNIYRVLQEILGNIIKYAEATKIDLQITSEENHLTIMCEDNGKGFDKSLLINSSGNGWSNIKSRLNVINGTIEIDSKPMNGTVVFIEVPV